ncbi:small ribosomal subunit protein mS35 [Neocloeon triangulifer]|uniref:small ribosomal subunit protein mS35 n=1 Tax=Neocloeon triangulifer TaxID=2078957 RepID=UPI00286EEC8A|nr:small ribosomal subunit protein mS35 [Neocloeon triangulifer]
MLANSQRFRVVKLLASYSSTDAANTDFRVLDLRKGAGGDGLTSRSRFQRRSEVGPQLLPPRETRMPIDQDWPSVWPGPRSFHPASVPLPVRQGYPARRLDAPPGKYANAELMKIPNFLHLTPLAVQRHCQAIKKFCTPWPKVLENDDACEKHFPIETTTSDYLHSSPSIRDPLGRIVTLQVKLSSIPVEGRARDKFLRLINERYDPKTDLVTIVTDRCPTKKQNFDYANFLLTVVYHESLKEESWESEKCTLDNELFDWQTSASRVSIEQLSSRNKNLEPEHVQLYSEALTKLMDKGEDQETLADYKERTLRMLGHSRN